MFGIAVALLVGAAEFLLHVTEFDVYGLSPLTPGVKTILENKDYVSAQNRLLHFNNDIARSTYNIAIFLVFGGLLFIIWPDNNWIAVVVFVVGIAVEVIQVKRTKTHKLK
ncbi:MAG: hypothetical protein ABSF44_09380 [Candidatus Bathyarchaeia archaeon]